MYSTVEGCILSDHSICFQIRWQTPDQDINVEKIYLQYCKWCKYFVIQLLSEPDKHYRLVLYVASLLKSQLIQSRTVPGLVIINFIQSWHSYG